VGAWGTGSFENDDAADWVGKLGTITPDDLTKVLVRAADDPAYLEAPAASAAVAAGEVVAALNGSVAEGAPAAIADWAKKHPKAFTPELKALAMRTLDRVRKNSELKDLWMEADGLNDWIGAMQELQGRLER
jgi:ABC-type taurine transport system substrate-binding protein